MSACFSVYMLTHLVVQQLCILMCTCIFVNVLLLILLLLWSLSFFLISVHIRLVLAGQFILHFTLLIISKIFTPSVYFAPVTLTEEQILNRESFQTGVFTHRRRQVKVFGWTIDASDRSYWRQIESFTFLCPNN